MNRAICVALDKVNPRFYGGWDGACPGTWVDQGRHKELFEKYFKARVRRMWNNQATDGNFEKWVGKGLVLAGERDLLMGAFSGHGGQQPDLDGEELDGMDETICLWNGEYKDDRLGRLMDLAKAGQQMLFISDSCNSGTQYRGMRIRRSTPIRVAPVLLTPGAPAVEYGLFWFAGCADGRSSYGDDQGGEWTEALHKYLRVGMTPEEWFAAAAKRMPRYQQPLLQQVGRIEPWFRSLRIGVKPR